MPKYVQQKEKAFTMNHAHFVYNTIQPMKLVTRRLLSFLKKQFVPYRTTALILAALISLPLQSAPLEEPLETTLWTVQFAVLHASNITALESEAWSNSMDDRQSILSKLSALPEHQAAIDPQIQTSNTPTQTPTSMQAQELLQLLSPLTRSRRFGVLLATEWTQPSSQKKKKLPFYTDAAAFNVYETVFGTLSLEERNSLIAQVDLTIVDQDTLSLMEKQPELKLFQDDSASLTSLDRNPELSLPESQLELAPILQETGQQDETADELPSTEKAHPILFLKQQRQVQLDRVHYFDHPVTPGFLLVSKTTNQQAERQ